MVKWMQNFGYNIDIDDWAKIWKTNIRITKSVNFKENLYKMFYKWYITSEKLARMFKGSVGNVM